MKNIGIVSDPDGAKTVFEIATGQYGVENLDGIYSDEDLLSWESEGRFSRSVAKPDAPDGGFASVNERFSSRAWLPFLLGIVGFAAFLLTYETVFWQPPLQLNISKPKAELLGARYLGTVHKPLKGYASATSFSTDMESLTFLERKLGRVKTQHLIDSGLPYQSWDLRWFKNLQEEEFNVSVDPVSGRWLAYERVLPEDAPGRTLSRAAARSTALAFLAANNYHVKDYKLVRSDREKLKNRTDWDFEWKGPERGLGGATRRVEVAIAGSSISFFSDFVQTPTKWSRDFDRTMSVGDLLSVVAMVITGILFVTLLGLMVFFLIKRQKLPWKMSFVAALPLLVISVLQAYSSSSELAAAYTTEIPYGVFIAGAAIALVVGLGLAYGLQAVMFATASASSRRYLGSSSSVILANGVRGQSWHRRLSRSVLAGFGLAGVMLGYTALFYLGAQKFLGAWAPAMPSYDSLVASRLPWVLPIGMGLTAALAEETLFRWFAISIGKKYLRLMPLALLLPALLWAFGHSGYAVFPVYLRGIELTITGVVIGIFFLKFGIESTIAGHFLFNVFLATLDLLYISQRSFRYQGLAILAILGAALLAAVAAESRHAWSASHLTTTPAPEAGT